MLAKLGKMTLAQKINKAAETGETEEDAAKHLKGMLSKEEHSKAWSKHNVSMSHKSQKEKKEFSKLSKGEKGIAGGHAFAQDQCAQIHANERICGTVQFP